MYDMYIHVQIENFSQSIMSSCPIPVKTDLQLPLLVITINYRTFLQMRQQNLRSLIVIWAEFVDDLNLCNHPIMKSALLVNETSMKIFLQQKLKALTNHLSTGFLSGMHFIWPFKQTVAFDLMASGNSFVLGSDKSNCPPTQPINKWVIFNITKNNL